MSNAISLVPRMYGNLSVNMQYPAYELTDKELTNANNLRFDYEKGTSLSGRSELGVLVPSSSDLFTPGTDSYIFSELAEIYSGPYSAGNDSYTHVRPGNTNVVVTQLVPTPTTRTKCTVLPTAAITGVDNRDGTMTFTWVTTNSIKAFLDGVDEDHALVALSGSIVRPTSFGPHTYAITGVDAAGNQASASATVTIFPPLIGLFWKLPCIINSSVTCSIASPVNNSLVLPGLPGRTYAVTFRIRGVIETKAYADGTNDGQFWNIGGTGVNVRGANNYKLTITTPSGGPDQVYYINRAWGAFPDGSFVYPVDYSKTVNIETGATVTLHADDGGDATEASNHLNRTAIDDDTTRPIVVTQPYNGQFAQIDATSIVLLP